MDYKQGTAHSSLLCVQVPWLCTAKHKPELVSWGWESSEFRNTLAQAVALVEETTAREPGAGTASGVWSWPMAKHRTEALLRCEHAGSLLNRNAALSYVTAFPRTTLKVCWQPLSAGHTRAGGSPLKGLSLTLC